MAPVDDLIADMKVKIARATTVQTSAAALIRGIPALIAAARDEALANGATEEELAPFIELNEALATASANLETAITENTTP